MLYVKCAIGAVKFAMRAIERTISILEAFDAERTSMPLMELAGRVKLSGATTYRLVRALEKAGYLIRLENQEYCLSFRVVRLAGFVDSTVGIKQIARPAMTELARRSNESVSLNTISGRYRVCIDVIDTPSPLMSIRKAGEHVKLSTGATTKTLIAYLNGKARDRAINLAIKASGEERGAFVKELDSIRRRGYAATYGQAVIGLGAVAVPIRGLNNAVEYCLSIGGPTVRIRPQERRLVDLSLAAAADISRRLGAEG